MRAALALLVLTLAACGGSSDADAPFAPAAALGHEYVLGYGETLRLEGGLSIEFTQLVEESRCPDSTVWDCFWEGNARILLTVTTPRAESVVELNTTGLARRATVDGYLIELRKLDPYPGSPQTGPPPPANYEATLFVDRAAANAIRVEGVSAHWTRRNLCLCVLAWRPVDIFCTIFIS